MEKKKKQCVKEGWLAWFLKIKEAFSYSSMDMVEKK